MISGIESWKKVSRGMPLSNIPEAPPVGRFHKDKGMRYDALQNFPCFPGMHFVWARTK